MKTNLLKIKNLALLNNGVTYSLNTGATNPDTGYMVSLQGHEEKSTYIDEVIIADYCKRKSELLANDNHYLGLWYDSENWYLDVSENIEEKRNAIFYGIIRSQRAIWDCAKQAAITLPEPQRAGTETQQRDYAYITSNRY